MMNLTKPRFVIPFHGDAQRQRLHAGLAESVGIDPDDIFIGPERRRASTSRTAGPSSARTSSRA